QRELSDTENRLELARAYYNNIATFYNTRLERIPDNIVATLARLKNCELLLQSKSDGDSK
ncbi:LemA family protein, partial [Mesotoga prima]